MPLISLRDVSITFGEQVLLDKVNCQIEPKERVCILGRNGMGKSTLLKLIHGELPVDSREIIRQSQLVTAKLEQDIPVAIKGSIYEVVASGLGAKGALLARYQYISQQLATDHSDHMLNQLEVVQHELDKQHAWDLAHQIEGVLSKLELPGEQNFATLSGGLKRRVLLGKALVTAPDLLMLDEPTNHLDIKAITWLENCLLNFKGSVVFITHDRVFLQNLATRIIEIDRGNVKNFACGYMEYLERKQHDLEIEEIHNKLFDKRLQQEEAWIRQGIKARRTRNEGRVRALQKLRATRQERRVLQGKVKMQLQRSEISGKIVIEAENICYAYEQSPLINEFSTIILRGDKIGIVGPNGVGKTTLLKILLGELAPQSGQVTHGTNLEIAYFDQLRAQLEDEKTAAENVSYGDQFVTINNKEVHIMSYLQDFLFSPDRARTKVKCLSGGERNRLLLARLFSKPANMLVLDEPTNDLDLETLELLEELLLNYSGTLLLVSHDRSFLNNVVTSTIVFEAHGNVLEYVGGYDDWLRQRQEILLEKKPAPKHTAAPPKPPINTQRQKQLQAIERHIEKCEAQKKLLEDQLADPALYAVSQSDKQKKLHARHEKLVAELTALMSAWEKLAEG
jgi:ABC transport system ATP-binding/permease protein